MEIRNVRREDREQIISYYKTVFANYKHKVELANDVIDFWFAKNDDECSLSMVLDDNGTIRGLVLCSSFLRHFRGDVENSYWFFDLFVDEELRKENWGIDFFMRIKKQYSNSCATGSNDLALSIFLKIGCKWMGSLRKYCGVCHPLYLIHSFFRKSVSVKNFPSRIVTKNSTFDIINSENIPSLSNAYNSSLWEPARDESFLRWRFFNAKLSEYAFYYNAISKSYFVLRIINKMGMKMMEIVDYRFNTEHPDEFEEIISAVKQIMNKVHIAVWVCGSSLKAIDHILEKNGLKSVGRPRPIIGFQKVKEYKTEIDNREFAFVTFADSDGEISM